MMLVEAESSWVLRLPALIVNTMGRWMENTV